jgi:hypothetical protein
MSRKRRNELDPADRNFALECVLRESVEWLGAGWSEAKRSIDMELTHREVTMPSGCTAWVETDVFWDGAESGAVHVAVTLVAQAGEGHGRVVRLQGYDFPVYEEERGP